MLHPVVQRDRSLHMTTPSNALCGKRILLADNEAEVRVGWSIRLEGFGLSVESCASGAELEHILTTRSAAFDAVTVDLKGMGSDHTFEQALSTLAQTFAATPFIILSSDDTLAWKFLKSSNIRGYALKIDQVEALCAIRPRSTFLLDWWSCAIWPICSAPAALLSRSLVPGVALSWICHSMRGDRADWRIAGGG
jgi:CheY-like chemotaxis protein